MSMKFAHSLRNYSPNFCRHQNPILQARKPFSTATQTPNTTSIFSNNSPLRQVYILSAARTPLGAFDGVFRDISAIHLGAVAVGAALAKGNVLKDGVEALYLGNVLSAGLGQSPAKQVCSEAGLPDAVNCMTINKVCASGLKATTIAASEIALGLADVIVCGGMESMNRTPYYLPKLRYGARRGPAEAVDGMIYDGLRDAQSGEDLGMVTERWIKKMGITRQEQDNFAARSYSRAAHATFEKTFEWELAPVPMPGSKAGREGKTITDDEEVKRFEDIEDLPQLKPIFSKEEGTLTLGNTSTLSDGAAALVLASEQAIERRGFKPIARILSYADVEGTSSDFPAAASKAISKALRRAKLEAKDVDLFEINEASAAVSVVNQRELDLDHDKVNVFGGAVALGNPLGASGARILVTLLNALSKKDLSVGVAGIGNGGGGATAIVVEKMEGPTDQ